MRHNSCAIYFHASSWANLFCLTWGVLASMLATFTNNNPATYNIGYCKIRFYMISFSQMSSRACVVLACLDRLLLCSRSPRKRLFCRPSVAIKVVLVTIFFCACLPIYILVTYEPQLLIRQCLPMSQSVRTFEIVNLWLLGFGAPTLLMSILSSLTLWRLKQNAKRIGRQKLSFYVYTLTAPSFRRELLLLILPRRWAIKLRQKEQHQMSLTNRIGPSRLDGTSIKLKVMPRNVVATNL
ncbi:unnamed protein product [Rotaria sordida]|uniref:G-protein coupled receptors family 1 profile domain-containing protein n=1 Tax=Rotaria sordida TaxID=392033 RepID=A0A815JB38_9BILA|nr:unnamed protein product [Rotaria sordida]